MLSNRLAFAYETLRGCERRMFIHYIEDDEIDILILKRIASSEPSIDLTVSDNVDGLAERIESHPVDIVLLDVHRPDSVSIEDDLARIRKISAAPVVLLTGAPTEELRVPAIRSGASAVVDKGAISKELLVQILANANAEYAARNALFDDEPEEDGDLSPEYRRLALPLKYVEAGLETLRDVIRGTSMAASAGFVSHLLETVRAVDAYATSDLSTATRTPVHQLLVRYQRHIEDLARSKGVELTMNMKPAWYFQVGSEPMARLGVQHLLEGVMRLCARPDTVEVDVEADESSAELKIFVSRPLAPNASMFFGGDGFDALELGARSSLQLGVLLLSLRPQQIEVAPDGSRQRISIFL